MFLVYFNNVFVLFFCFLCMHTRYVFYCLNKNDHVVLLNFFSDKNLSLKSLHLKSFIATKFGTSIYLVKHQHIYNFIKQNICL